MAVRWNPDLLRDICILPAAITDTQLQKAGHLQLKVLLWFAGHERDGFDLSACAAALHKSVDVIEEALGYWYAQGVLCADDVTPVTSPVPVASAPVTAPAEPPTPAARPKAVKPQFTEVVAKQKSSPEFSGLLDTVSVHLGKPLSHGDTETLLYLYDTAGIPAAVILMAVDYAVSRNTYGMRYIEKVLLGWLDDGITTLAAAEEHLQMLERTDIAADKVKAMLGRARDLDYRSRQMAYTWVYTWGFSDELIRLALNKAANTAKSPIPYADTILASWHAADIHDAVAAARDLENEPKKKKRNRKTENSSLDLQSYESMLENYIPALPQK